MKWTAWRYDFSKRAGHLTTDITPEFKNAAALQFIERKYSVVKVLTKLGISAHYFYKWVRADMSDKRKQQVDGLIARCAGLQSWRQFGVSWPPKSNKKAR
jgi:hypothetical protein